MITLRPYQEAAVSAVDEHLSAREDTVRTVASEDIERITDHESAPIPAPGDVRNDSFGQFMT